MKTAKDEKRNVPEDYIHVPGVGLVELKRQVIKGRFQRKEEHEIFTEAYLRRRYLLEKDSTNMIAGDHGKPASQVAYWMRRYGIQPRTRKQAWAVQREQGRAPERKPRVKRAGRKPRVKLNAGCYGVYCPDHPRAKAQGYVFEHHLVWEKANGRKLPAGFVVYHINSDKGDNRPENLRAFSRSEFIRFSWFLRFVYDKQNYKKPPKSREDALEWWERLDDSSSREEQGIVACSA